MMTATLGIPSPGYTSPVGTVIPAQRSLMLGELIVVVGWVSKWEEDHDIAITEGHEL
jgi:cell division inhibitor SulA